MEVVSHGLVKRRRYLQDVLTRCPVFKGQADRKISVVVFLKNKEVWIGEIALPGGFPSKRT